ncbi:MAG: flagellar assembly protein FliW [Nitrospinae bacterium]|nr:flagellar assembly protein FliW [Nitrospinota bacterium]
METSTISFQRAGTLTVETTRFGELTIAEAQIIMVSGGLLGFPGFTRYVILNHDQEQGIPFRWLQSVEHPALAVVIIDPWVIKPDYTIELPDDVCESLHLSEEQPPLVFAIVTVPLEPVLMTANLQGPLVINPATRKAQQVVLTNSLYTTRHLILGELWQTGNGNGDDVAASSFHHSAV